LGFYYGFTVNDTVVDGRVIEGIDLLESGENAELLWIWDIVKLTPNELVISFDDELMSFYRK
jgi:hypothetical protein